MRRFTAFGPHFERLQDRPERLRTDTCSPRPRSGHGLRERAGVRGYRGPRAHEADRRHGAPIRTTMATTSRLPTARCTASTRPSAAISRTGVSRARSSDSTSDSPSRPSDRNAGRQPRFEVGPVRIEPDGPARTLIPRARPRPGCREAHGEPNIALVCSHDNYMVGALWRRGSLHR